MTRRAKEAIALIHSAAVKDLLQVRTGRTAAGTGIASEDAGAFVLAVDCMANTRRKDLELFAGTANAVVKSLLRPFMFNAQLSN